MSLMLFAVEGRVAEVTLAASQIHFATSYQHQIKLTAEHHNYDVA